MGLLSEGSSPKGTKAYSEKDLGSSMELIIKGDFLIFVFVFDFNLISCLLLLVILQRHISTAMHLLSSI
jgi:hypothetical protein